MLKRRSYGRRFFSFGSSFFIRFPDDWLGLSMARHWSEPKQTRGLWRLAISAITAQSGQADFASSGKIFGEKAEAGYISRVLCRATERIAMIRRRSLSS
jgi:hypothetical protein